MDEDEKMNPTDVKKADSKAEMWKKILEIERFFKEADVDGGGSLDVDEFSSAMRPFYPDHNEEQLIALHMQIDANCDGGVDFGELLQFNMSKLLAEERFNFDRRLFPLASQIVKTNHYNKIVKFAVRPLEDVPVDTNPQTGLQEYVEEEYISVASDGVLTFWSNRFKEKSVTSISNTPNALPFEHKRRIHVTDMVYMKEREEVAIATTGRDLRFYIWAPGMLIMKYAIVTHGGRMTALSYWSDVAFEEIKQENYNCARISTLLQESTREYLAFKVPLFDTIVTIIKYFPFLEKLAVCSISGHKLILLTIPRSNTDKIDKIIYATPRTSKSFLCVEHCFKTQDLVTGGVDGVLRTWHTYKPNCKFEMQAHDEPITYVLDNPENNVVVCIHDDQTVCVWSLQSRNCLQKVKQEEDIGSGLISAVYYGLQNNELIMANTEIGILLGRGTDLFKEMLSSHTKPVCGAIYHNIFRQVISVCQKGIATVWDVNTGKTVMQFNVSPFQLIASTAIALNDTQRKIITVCNEGRVRFWNFNNGQELEVLPVTVPMVISGIISTEEMVFLSSKETNFIYCLDMEGLEPKYMEHPLMEGGVTSMSSYPHDSWLVSASGNGIVLVWDMESLQTIYCINEHQSPKIHKVIHKDFMGQISTLPIEKTTHFLDNYERIPVPKRLLDVKTDKLEPKHFYKNPLVHCLKSRIIQFDLATVLVADGGFVSAWSGTAKGGLLAKFKAIEDEGTKIMCIDTDPNDQILMIGDINGFVHVWNIEQFGKIILDSDAPAEEIDHWKVNLTPPPFLQSWKAHMGAITSFTCNPSCENFVTTGFDCNVNLWTNKQHRVGTFGKDQWEVHELHPDWQEKHQAMELEMAESLLGFESSDSRKWQLEDVKSGKLAEFEAKLNQTDEFVKNWKQRQNYYETETEQEVEEGCEEESHHEESPGFRALQRSEVSRSSFPAPLCSSQTDDDTAEICDEELVPALNQSSIRIRSLERRSSL
ncbi:hypothetical protein WMY93_031462 [Mugilogobius chulae]|uniref:WD repeat-containing protein on Y chromosome n=1 Tax=Mugilogobius chulae TaxID=88201 RepID=A0AAW0MHR5_9GOBI